MVDSGVIRCCQKGEKEAFRTLFTAMEKKAFWTAYLMTGRKVIAEDIVQEAFLECFLNIGKLQNPELFQVWFNRIQYSHMKVMLKTGRSRQKS